MAIRVEEAADVTPADFDAFYAAYEPRVRALVQRKIRHRHRADDLVQDTFLRAFKSHDTFDPTRPAWPWLATIANNVVIDFSRRKSTAGEFPAEIHQLERPASDDPVEQLHRSDQRAAIADALGELTDGQRRVLMLREIDELRYDAVAQREGVSVDSVKSTLKRARANFRHAYDALAKERGLLGGVLVPLRYLRNRVQAASSLAEGAVLPLAAAVATVTLGVGAVGGLVTIERKPPARETALVRVGADAATGRGDPVPSNARAAAAAADAVAALPRPPTAMPLLGDSGSTNRIEVGDNLSHTFTYRVEVFGKYVQLRGLTYTQCHTNVAHEALCELIKTIPGTVVVGQPQPTPAPPSAPPPVATHPLPAPL